MRRLPDGYEIRTVPAGPNPKLALYFDDRRLADRWPDIYGYAATIRYLNRIARMHAKNRIDR